MFLFSFPKKKQENLSRALSEFKRDKINRQNARLSLVNSVYENPSMPRRKILLSVGANNYRPPLERSKSAPRLMSIEEAIGEEDEEEEGDADENGCSGANENELKKVKSIPESRSSCCDIDPLYPAMTLGRRRCRKGHSIRRTGNRSQRKSPTTTNENDVSSNCNEHDINDRIAVSRRIQSTASSSSTTSCSSDDDLDKLLVCHNYDKKSPLAGELLSYFDMKVCSIARSLIDLDDDNFDALSSDESHNHVIHAEHKRTSVSLDDLDQYEDEDVFYSQDNILDILANESKKRTDTESLANDDNSTTNQHHIMRHKTLLNNDDVHIKPLTTCLITNGGHQILSLDSDEGSISSGCETASTVTTTNFDEFPQMKDDKDEISSNCDGDNNGTIKMTFVSATIKRNGKSSYKNKIRNDDSDSEFSDESGYVEESNNNSLSKVVSI